MESCVTFVRIRAESTNLMQNHPLRSYKHDRITLEHSKRVQTPTGPSGQILSTQRQESTARRREHRPSESYELSQEMIHLGIQLYNIFVPFRNEIGLLEYSSRCIYGSLNRRNLMVNVRADLRLILIMRLKHLEK